MNGNWVNLSELPTRGKEQINWKKSIGYVVKFKYGDIEDEFSIVDYISKGSSVFIKHNYSDDFEINSSHLARCKLGNLLGRQFKCNFQCNIGDVFKDNKRDLIITDREYKKDNISREWYKYTCNKCGWTEGWMTRGSIKQGIGCGCCDNKIAVLGINTIFDTNPEMIKLGISEEDAKSHTRGSGKKINVICSNCRKSKNISIKYVYKNKSISCNNCNDGISYPEKFIASLLNQVNLDFKTQLSKTTFKWCENCRYDFYINSQSCIIETHGEQHYKHTGRGRRLQEEQQNDKNKYDLAIANGIKPENYIVIDCRKSELEFIKNNILNSRLAEIFDLSKIDWFKCEEFALKNLVKEVCDYWSIKQECESTKDLAKSFNLSRTTILKYLKQGVKHNWCKYNPKEKLGNINNFNSAKKSGKKVVIFKDDINLGEFYSCGELERQSLNLFGVKLLNQNISSVCNGKLKQYKGYTFKYIEENKIAA